MVQGYVEYLSAVNYCKVFVKFLTQTVAVSTNSQKKKKIQTGEN